MTDEDFADIIKEGFMAGLAGVESEENPYKGVQGGYWWQRGWVVGRMSDNSTPLGKTAEADPPAGGKP